MSASLFASWQFLAVLAAVFAALGAIFAKLGVEGVPSDLVTLVRTVVILAALTVFLLLTRQLHLSSGTLSRRSLIFISLSGIAGAASWIFHFRALKVGEVAQVAPIDKMSIILIALLGVVVLRERLSAINWLGILLAVSGAILVGYR